MVDETGDHFVVYFLPTEETKQQRRQDAENHTLYSADASYEYEKAREYNWNVKNKTMANYEENYFFVFRKEDKDGPAGAYYNELETRVRLSKRRKTTQGGYGTGMPPQQQTSGMRLVVTHRDFTDEEFQAQAARIEMLKHESEDEAEEEEETAAAPEEEDRRRRSSLSSGASSPAGSPRG